MERTGSACLLRAAAFPPVKHVRGHFVVVLSACWGLLRSGLHPAGFSIFRAHGKFRFPPSFSQASTSHLEPSNHNPPARIPTHSAAPSRPPPLQPPHPQASAPPPRRRRFPGPSPQPTHHLIPPSLLPSLAGRAPPTPGSIALFHQPPAPFSREHGWNQEEID